MQSEMEIQTIWYRCHIYSWLHIWLFIHD
jgi:hypothetical protein